MTSLSENILAVRNLSSSHSPLPEVLMPCTVLNKIAKEFKEVGGEICISVNEEGILFEGQADLMRMRVKITAQVPSQ